MSASVVAVVCGVYEGRLLVGFCKVLAYCSMTQEGGVGSSQQGSTPLDPAHWQVMLIVLSSVGGTFQKCMNSTEILFVESCKTKGFQCCLLVFMFDMSISAHSPGKS